MVGNNHAPRGGGGRGRGQPRGGWNTRGDSNQSSQPQTYGIDPEDLREMQEKKTGPFAADSGPSNTNTNARAARRPAHNRPPLKIAGNPDKQYDEDPGRFNRSPQDQYANQRDLDAGGEMNAHISERLRATKRPEAHQRGQGQFGHQSRGIPRNPLIEKYEKINTSNIPGWRGYPEVPTAGELMGDEVELPCNEVEQPWDTVEEYLGAHYELLREDSFAPLRDCVGFYRANTHMDDSNNMCIYEDCRIVGLTFANPFGICIKMSFSTNRARKKIRWNHSKRLCPGTLVALSTDNFRNSVRVATVVARPLEALESPEGPEVDLILDKDELEIDPTKKWIMIESRSSYFEAYKHTLKALQRMNESNFPLQRILRLQEKKVQAPEYLRDNPVVDISPCFLDSTDSGLRNINILQHFPSKNQIQTSMDESQLEALRRILTKELGIIQGPPGCGKTFISVQAIASLLKNKKPKDPPIIVACHTNHALDQLLRHIIDIEPDVIRLGGRTQDQDKVKERTLRNCRRESDPFEILGSSLPKCKANLRRLENRAMELVEHFQDGKISPDTFYKYKLLTKAQCDSFRSFSEEWVKNYQGVEKVMSPMVVWLGNYLAPIVRNEDLTFEYEEEDIGAEELKDLEAEYRGDEERDDKLYGRHIQFRRDVDIHGPLGITDADIKQALKNDDVWEIHDRIRPHVYRRLETQLMEILAQEMRKISKEYSEAVTEFKIARWERDAHILSRAKLVGMTTTGVSKYRSLVAALQPKICLIEEAAETLEGPLIAACYPTIQQLILVGDHKQLRGHCSVKELESAPYNLAMSMFERLVDNGIEFTMLTRQRRMRPEIRQIIMPIYNNLEDDDSVLNRPSIPGMGNTNLFFFSHVWPEEREEMSKKNKLEAVMVANLCNYLVHNGMDLKDITIITFYTGQLRELHRQLRQHPRLSSGMGRIRIATVDSFQGEENEIIILSLCRSNNEGAIGFLSVENRVCVALSRAKRGFYMFGNAQLMASCSGLWWDVLQIMASRKPSLVSTSLPITCQKHRKRVQIDRPEDWLDIDGGCKEMCPDTLNCGHKCTLRCHPFEHDGVQCIAPCNKRMGCGHNCRDECWKPCRCEECERLKASRKKYAREYDDEYEPEVDVMAERMAEVNFNQNIRPENIKPARVVPVMDQGQNFPKGAYYNVAAGQGITAPIRQPHGPGVRDNQGDSRGGGGTAPVNTYDRDFPKQMGQPRGETLRSRPPARTGVENQWPGLPKSQPQPQPRPPPQQQVISRAPPSQAQQQQEVPVQVMKPRKKKPGEKPPDHVQPNRYDGAASESIRSSSPSCSSSSFSSLPSSPRHSGYEEEQQSLPTAAAAATAAAAEESLISFDDDDDGAETTKIAFMPENKSLVLEMNKVLIPTPMKKDGLAAPPDLLTGDA